MKMNQEIKEEWVADLRSGEIHKTKNRLRNGNRMCTLGVLCNVHAKHHPEIAAAQTKKSEYIGQNADLPNVVQRWAFDSNTTPKLKYNGSFLGIAYLNDETGLSFKQIAKLIEEQL